MMGTYYSDEEEEGIEDEYYDYYNSDQEEDEYDDMCSYERPSHAFAIERQMDSLQNRNQEH